MGDDEIYQKTQDLLGKLISRPKMTDKYLKKPPFRFLHDIVMEVTKTTTYGQGLFTTEECDAAQLSDKPAKVEFLNKAISCCSFALGEKIDVSASKIVAGLEADKTNLWLQKLHQAATTCAGAKSDEAVQRVLSGESAAGSKKEKKKKDEDKEEKKEKDKDKDRDRDRDKEKEKEKDKAAAEPSAAAEGGDDEEAKKEEEKKKRAEAKRRKEEKEKRKAEEEAAAKAAAEAAAAEPPAAEAPAGSDDEDERKRRKEEERAKKEEDRRRREEKKKKQAEEEERKKQEAEAAAAAQAEAEKAAAAAAAAAAEEERRREAAAAAAADPTPPGSAAQGARPAPSESPQQDPHSDMIGGHPEPEDDAGMMGRPTRMERPRTAGRKPPKVTSKVQTSVQEPQQNVAAPTIIAEGAAKDDDDEDMFEDNRPLGQSSILKADEGAAHGMLVRDLMAEKKQEEEKERLRKEEERTREVDDGDKSIKLGRLKRKKDATTTATDVDVAKLGTDIQGLCMAANPLGKSIDLVHQDIANMGKELDHWRQEFREASEQYATQLRMTDEMLQPLYQKIAQLDDQVAAYSSKIRNSRSRMAKNDLKIQSLLESVVMAK